MNIFKKFFKKGSSFPACMEGTILPLDNVPDPVFSSRSMGDGFAIELTGTKVVSPFDGELTLCYPTGHAYGIKAKDGTEILIHIGIDTVELNGEGFEVLVKQDNTINKGDTLVNLNLDLIKSKGKSVISPVIFTSGEKVTLLKKDEKVSLLEENFISY